MLAHFVHNTNKHFFSFTYRQLAKLEHHIIRIIRIPHSIRPSQQHLKRNIRYHLSHIFQSLPWALMQKPQGHIKGSTTPIFNRIQLTKVVRNKWGNFQQIVRSHSGRQQRLVGITISCVHQ